MNLYILILSLSAAWCAIRLLVTKPLFILLSLGGIIWPLINGQKSWDCREFTDTANRLTVDCSFKEHDMNIPNDLNPEAQVLNLSGNRAILITNTSFDRYKDNLVILDLSNSHDGKNNSKMETGCFSQLYKLQILDLSATCFPLRGTPHYYFPASLKIFKYEDCIYHRTVNLTEMIGIEELHAFNSRFRAFPIFNILSPIKYVDLREHELTDLRVLDIAGYCHLEEIKFKMRKNKGLQHNTRYCECMDVVHWLKRAKVNFTQLNCTKPRKNQANCKFNEVDQKAINERYECLHPGLGLIPVLTRWFPIFLIFVVLCSALAIYLVKRRLKKRKAESEEGKNEDNKERESVNEMDEERVQEEEIHNHDHPESTH